MKIVNRQRFKGFLTIIKLKKIGFSRPNQTWGSLQKNKRSNRVYIRVTGVGADREPGGRI